MSACVCERGRTFVCFTRRYAAVKRSSLSFVTVTFKSFLKLGGSIYQRRPAPTAHTHTPTHTLSHSHTHSSERLLDKPLTFALQSLRSISRPFFHVMFTSLWAIWPQWGDCLWSTTCVHRGHFPRRGPREEAIRAARRPVTFLHIERSETFGSGQQTEVGFLLINFVLLCFYNPKAKMLETNVSANHRRDETFI